MKCSNCNKECKVIYVDFGVGRTEFWGVPGVDTDEQPVTNCCESHSVIDDDGTRRDADELVEEIEDYRF